MLARILVMVALLAMAGCAALEEGYTARYGLANPDTRPVHPDIVDESQASGSIGQQYIEDYDKKYREKDIFDRPETEPLEEQEAQKL